MSGQNGKHRTPRLSIGMPVFNEEARLQRAIDAVLGQTFSDFELVISDNASTDRTEQIARAAASADSRVRYIRQPRNVGIQANFRFVFTESVAPYFMWAAGNDQHEPTFAERCVAVLDTRPGIGIAMTEWTVLGRTTGSWFAVRDFPSFAPLESPNPKERVEAFIRLSSSVSHKANFFHGVWRRELLADMLQRFSHLTSREAYLGGDIAQLVYVLSRFGIAQVPGVGFRKINPGFAIGSLPHRLRIALGQVVHPVRTLRQRNDSAASVAYTVSMLEFALKEGGLYDDDFEALLEWKRRQPVGS